MRPFHRLTTSLLIAFAVVASAPVNAHAGWGSWFKPDIAVAKVMKSNVSPNHVRVILTNTAYWGTGSFYVWVKVHKSSPKYGYYKVTGMPGQSGLGFDVYVGTNINSSPGLVTEVRADIFNSVAEYNESNNTGYHISPPW